MPPATARTRLVTTPLLAALLIAATAGSAFAADTGHKTHAGYFDGMQFAELADPEGELIEVNLTGKLLRLLSTRAVKRHDENLATILGELVSIQAVIAEVEPSRVDEVRTRVDAVREQLRQRQWERFVRVRDGKEEFTAYVHMDADEEIDGLIVIGFIESDELLFVNLAGRVDMERIAALGDHFGVPVLDELSALRKAEVERERIAREKRRAPGTR